MFKIKKRTKKQSLNFLNEQRGIRLRYLDYALDHPYNLFLKDPNFIEKMLQSNIGVRAGMSLASISTAILTTFLFSPSFVYALPQGGQVVSGASAISQDGPTMQIQQTTDKSIINWQGYGISANEAVKYIQPNSDSMSINRVIGLDPTKIYGQLSANGIIWVINPNGILVGPGAVINTASFLASTMNINNNDFLAGNYTLRAENGLTLSEIINQGNIQASEGGYVVLAGGKVRQEGNIVANFGKVAIGAGDEMVLSFVGNDLINFRVEGKAIEKFTIDNKGKILADGGTVILTAKGASDIVRSVINNDGIVEANSFINRNGVIEFIGNSQTEIKNTGVIDASGQDINLNGGKIKIEGGFAILDGKIKADGLAGGNIDFSINSLNIASNGLISSRGGNVKISAKEMTLDGIVDVSSDTKKGGDIRIDITNRFDAMASSDLKTDGKEGGTIYLNGGSSADILTSGKMSAIGKEGRGGNIDVTGYKVSLFGGSVDVSGVQKGGNIHWGGNRGGKGDLLNAKRAIITGSLLSGGAEGGEIIVWSDEITNFHGDIKTGDRGFIEISSKDIWTFQGKVDAGKGGTVLFDPKNLEIVSSIDAITLAKLAVGSSNAGAGPNDNLGGSITMYGDLLAVGTKEADFGRGAVYLADGLTSTNFASVVFKKKLSNGVLNLNLQQGDNFGASVSMYNDTLAVGAPGTNQTQGAVYLFNGLSSANFAGLAVKNTISSTGVIGDRFGAAVSVYNDALAVGASGTDINKGAVYLFNNLSSSATLQKTIKSGSLVTGLTSIAQDDNFGASLSIYNDALAVGSPGKDSKKGVVYLFNGVNSANFGSIVMQKELKSGVSSIPTLEGNDNFGAAVSVWNNTLAVGAIGKNAAQGAVYLFDGLSSTNFTSTAMKNTLTSSVTTDKFGLSVAVYNNTLAIGSGKGEISLYTASNEAGLISITSIPTKSLTNDQSKGMITQGENFGSSISLDGDNLAVGAPNAIANGQQKGAVYLFNGLNNTSISQLVVTKKITDGFGLSLSENDKFGSAVSLNGDALAVGASGTDSGKGAVYLFNNLSSGLALKKTINSTFTGLTSLSINDYFGSSVALNGNNLAVGANGTISGTGRVYLFNGLSSSVDFGSTVQQGVINGVAPNSNFGVSLALNNNSLLGIGASGSKKVYIYNISTPLSPALSHTISSGDTNFGSGVSIDGKTIAISNGSTIYLYSNIDLTTLQQWISITPDITPIKSISLNNDRLAVGFTETDGAGKIYLYKPVSANSAIPYTNSMVFGDNPALDGKILSQTIRDILNVGSNLVLQASNNITVSSDIIVNNVSGDGGTLTLQAGKSVLLNKNITTDNGSLNVYANESNTNGVNEAYRDSGEAVILMGQGVSINAGNGTVGMNILSGSGRTGDKAFSGNLTLGNITAKNLNLGISNSTGGKGIVQNSGTILNISQQTNISATANGDAVLNSANNDFGRVDVSAGNNVTINDKNGIILGNISAANLTVNAVGNITDEGTIVVSNTAQFGATANGDVVLNSVSNDFKRVDVSAGKDVTFYDKNGIVLGNISAANLTVNAVGNITDEGTIAVSNTAQFGATANYSVVLDTIGNNFGSVLITSADFAKIQSNNGATLKYNINAPKWEIWQDATLINYYPRPSSESFQVSQTIIGSTAVMPADNPSEIIITGELMLANTIQQLASVNGNVFTDFQLNNDTGIFGDKKEIIFDGRKEVIFDEKKEVIFDEKKEIILEKKEVTPEKKELILDEKKEVTPEKKELILDERKEVTPEKKELILDERKDGLTDNKDKEEQDKDNIFTN